MKNRVIPTEFYEARFKRLKKKFRSLSEEMRELIEVLQKDPNTGESLGSGLYKIRLASKSKGKGKAVAFGSLRTYSVKLKKGLTFIS